MPLRHRALGWRGPIFGSQPGHDSVLGAVACAKAADCWAVGDYQNSNGAFFERGVALERQEVVTPIGGRLPVSR